MSPNSGRQTEVRAPAEFIDRFLRRDRRVGFRHVEGARRTLVEREQRGIGGGIDMHRRCAGGRIGSCSRPIELAISQHDAGEWRVTSDAPKNVAALVTDGKPIAGLV